MPPAVALGFRTLVNVGSSVFGTTVIAFAGTFPAVPDLTATTPTVPLEGSNCGKTLALGRVKVAVVWKAMPPSVETTLPLGIVFSEPVFKLWNVTLPLAGACSIRLSVAGNVSDAETGTSRR